MNVGMTGIVPGMGPMAWGQQSREPQSPLTSVIALIEKGLSEQESLLCQLENRLGPFLLPACAAETAAPQPTQAPPASELVNRLDCYASLIDAGNHSLARIISRLDA